MEGDLQEASVGIWGSEIGEKPINDLLPNQVTNMANRGFLVIQSGIG